MRSKDMPSSLGSVPHPPTLPLWLVVSEFYLDTELHSHLPTPCLLVVLSELSPYSSVLRDMAQVQEGLDKQTIFGALSFVAFEMEMKYKLKLAYKLSFGVKHV